MAKKWKNTRNRILEWFEDVFALMKENRKILLVVVIFVVAIAAAIVITNFLAGKSTEVKEAVVQTVETTDTSEVVIEQTPLETDAYPEINELMKKYYNSIASGDVLTASSLRKGIDEKERIVIEKKSEYVQSYPVITCYTKKGPTEDSYLVYVYYEVVLKGFEEQIPALNVWYVCKDENGSYYINEDTQDESIVEYCKVLSVQDDVVDLSNTVNVKYNEIIESNPDLGYFMQNLTSQMKVEVGDELAKAETGVEDEPVITPEISNEEETAKVKTVKTTTVVNVRASDSEKADKLGRADAGAEYELVEEKLNGWSEIIYEGQEAYIKTEFLEPAEVETMDETETDTESAAETDDEDDSEAVMNSPSSGTGKVKESVRVRSKASTDSEALATLYAGDTVEIVSKQSDGWTKINYKGKTAYIKSEFLE